jgi:uncharacterized protein (TIGR00369 family)
MQDIPDTRRGAAVATDIAAQARGGARARHVTWADPSAALQRLAAMSREGMLGALISGELPKPPIGELLGLELLEVEPGRAVFGLRPSEFHYNPVGTVAAGVTATALDAALWLAVQSRVAESTLVSTTSLSLHFVRPLTAAAGDVRAEASIVHVGRTTASGEARLVDATGKLYSHATAGFSCVSYGSR